MFDSVLRTDALCQGCTLTKKRPSGVEFSGCLHPHCKARNKRPMKKSNRLLLLLLALLCSPALLWAKTESRNLESQIDEVTVFLNRAQIFRSAAFRIPSGQFELIVDSVSPMILPTTLQVKGVGDFTILEARHHIEYVLPEDPAGKPLPEGIKKDIKSLQDSLRTVGRSIQWIDKRIQALDQERNILQSNPLMGGNDGASDTIPELRQSMDYFRERMLDIQELRFELEIDREELSMLRDKKQNRLNQLLAYQQQVGSRPSPVPRPVHQLRVVVLAKRSVSGTLECSYAVNGASWSPAYDLRSEGPSSKVELTYKANVRQNTGMNWDGVPLTLSTYDPSLGQTKPELPTWYVEYYQVVTRGRSQFLSDVPVPAMNDMALKSLDEIVEEDVELYAEMSTSYVEATQTFSNLEFAISLNYDIPADGQNHLVMVKEEELDASYVHYLVPKLAREAFIAAQVTGWEELDLLPGLANIFYDGTYIGQSSLNPETFGDTLDLPMGRDRLVVAERKRTEKNEKIKALSGHRIVEEAWELKIRNRHGAPVSVIVQDHLPVSADEDIQVKLEEGKPDRFDEARGLLEWEFELPSRVSTDRAYVWSLKHDKNKTLGLNQ